MKRAADDETRNSRERDLDAQDQSGPEVPSVNSDDQDKDRPVKRARQQSECGDEAETLEAISSARPEESKGQGVNSAGRDMHPQHGVGPRNHRVDETSREESKGEGENPPHRDCHSPHGERSRAQGADETSREESKSSAASAEGVAQRNMATMEFPAQLMSLLQRNVVTDAIWFLEGGEAIGLNRDLMGQVLNEHFRGMKFNSMVRNLNRWGFRRISHPSLKEKERGYHHLLFQRSKPYLVHRMKKDSKAGEVVRQLNLADGVEESPGDQSTQHESKTLTGSERTAPEPSSSPVSAHPSLFGRNTEHQHPTRPSQHGLRQGDLGNQQVFQGLSTHQQLEWQRQQNALVMQLGSMHTATWGSLGNWNLPQQTLPSASAFAYGLQQQQQQHMQAQVHARAAQQSAFASSVILPHRNPSNARPLPGEALAASSREANDQQDDEEYPQSSRTETNPKGQH